MNIRKLLIDFAITFAVTFLITAIVTLLWNLIFHRAVTVDWETSFRFAIIFGIVLPWMKVWESKRKNK
jgi:hypothetical protein